MNMENQKENQNTSRFGWRFALGWVAAVIVGVMVPAVLLAARHFRMQSQTVELQQTAARGPRVLAVPLSSGPDKRDLDIPATIHGYIETPVYAKVSGYLKTIYVDKGDRVRKGQLLAILQSPELDKQVADAKAYYWLWQVTDRRNQYLLKTEVIAQQMADQSHATLLQAQASYQQLLAMQSYEIVRAPFDGMITVRYVDPGNLVPQSTASSTNFPIVAISSLSPLRIYASVPQSDALYINDQDPASVSVPELPGRRFDGVVTRHPDALDPSTRTMLVEVDLPNRDQALYPGMYASVHINVNVPTGALTAPDDALIFMADHVFVPIVRGDRLHLQQVTLGHDDGINVQVIGPLHKGDLVAMNVGQSAHDGEPVQPVNSDGAAAPAGS
ncbi:MAG TPA: efflux RND transporter periplasmic adaptor subunit [Candidatus Binataceae bacterium]|nr:efflux RND transporter periplasmic adaptor subunit [Candidatus Binataceae bacterium]